ncbi:MarR family winged helix-turn-helix transcriptional regulator [Sporomusa acidovorans]|uniref:HTH marR-type domain-containing protein n=1 Tax=Sporomusa acidovorans (strain ATCC 49682 / DSM 3132 / Mol) TaxID=1123286 RepID=A0ABZ3J654_SPOA4|nr:MarR family winged helix-turn-helix transcriptional regulator [Sporomusa acidovorans]OZC18507.1 MarR family protein [Sporomusa acidovorans DSM 3132]SDE36864.1 DNA-binding transcriptional regulator, MarR family [Sporomusa acidovorans]
MRNEEDAFINATYRHLNNRHNNIYQFVIKYSDYINAAHDYGTGHILSMTEVHTLTYIEDNPGTTVTELAQHWSKTKSALSQTVSKLVDKGLVYRHKTETNAKTVLLYVTEEGLKLSKAHKLYDTITISKTLEDLSKYCTAEEIDAFYKVIGIFAKLL